MNDFNENSIKKWAELFNFCRNNFVDGISIFVSLEIFISEYLMGEPLIYIDVDREKINIGSWEFYPEHNQFNNITEEFFFNTTSMRCYNKVFPDEINSLDEKSLKF